MQGCVYLVEENRASRLIVNHIHPRIGVAKLEKNIARPISLRLIYSAYRYQRNQSRRIIYNSKCGYTSDGKYE